MTRLLAFGFAATLAPGLWAPAEAQELRHDAVRTPDERFRELTDFPYQPRYVSIDGLRMHYVDEGTGDAGTLLLLHGEPTWSYLYRRMIPGFIDAGYRIVAPDMIGFGRSDKVTDPDWYTAGRHTEMLKDFVRRLDLQDVAIVVQDWAGPYGLMAVADMPDRFGRLIILNTWLHHPDFVYTEAIRNWRQVSQNLDFTTQGLPSEEYRAPFHVPQATVGAVRWPWMLPFAEPEVGAAERQARTYDFLASWDKPAHVIFGDQDPIFTIEWGREFAAHIPGATFDVMPGHGHFVQEAGVPLVELILQRIHQ